MVKKRNEIIQYLIILILGIAIAAILIHMIPYRYKLNTVENFECDYNYIDNPLMGFAPDSEDEDDCENASLVFVLLSFEQWEPSEGYFDVEALEDRCNILRWKREGKHAVIRFVCDIPGDKEHMDIPGWLYDKTGDGLSYSNDYGKGYSPNYSNPIFMEEHKKALKALAEYCNQDRFVSFVELGSVGHWGEWHQRDNEMEYAMPDESVCKEYVSMYEGIFDYAHLLTRRSYDFTVENQYGVFNDMVGEINETNRWLDWLKNGGTQKTSGNALTISAYEGFGMVAPVGGEFTSSIPMNDMLGDGLGDLLSSITDSNMTFIGPKVPSLTESKTSVARQSILRRIGYRIYISRLETQFDFGTDSLTTTLVWENGGTAGFFFDWPVTLYVYNGNKELLYSQKLDLNLTDLNDGEQHEVLCSIPYHEDMGNEYYIGISVDGYGNGEKLILAQASKKKMEFIDESQVIYHYKR